MQLQAIGTKVPNSCYKAQKFLQFFFKFVSVTSWSCDKMTV